MVSFNTKTRHFTSLHFASYSVWHFCSASLGSYLIIPPLKPLKSHFSSLSSFPSESPFCSVTVLESHLYPSITTVIRFIHISHESGERLVLSWSNLCNLFIKSLWFWEIWCYSFFQKKIICLDSCFILLIYFLYFWRQFHYTGQGGLKLFNSLILASPVLGYKCMLLYVA